MTRTPKDKKFVPQGGEAQFIAALRTGQNCKFDGSLSKEERTLRGEVLSAVLSQTVLEGWGAIELPRFIVLEYAIIEGDLVLTEQEYPFALTIKNSVFLKRPNFYRSLFSFLSLKGSEMPGGVFSNIKIKSDLRLDEISSEGCLHLDAAIIGGQLSLKNASLKGVVEGMSLNLQGAKIEGALFLT